ncbi:MAG TPA: 7TM-DISM domain-containing protein, partial [Polyangiales bacterium]|nr:7TM-DISM domain-containing protein [Polyangiales bacterium]
MLLLPATSAAAEDTLVVTQQLAGEALGSRIETLEDPSGAWTVEQVSRPPLTKRFVRSRVDASNYGLTKSAYWVRFKVDNRQSESQPWTLELAYPPLDDIRLFVPGAAGSYELRVTGDHHPFEQRDVSYRTFLFELEESPGIHTYYLRAQTTGSVSLPLRAWSAKTFLDHLMTELPPLWIFYGLMLVMAAYNL